MAAPLLLLFFLPFPHTTALRLACLFATGAAAAVLWRSLQVPRLPCRIALGFWIGVSLASLLWAVDVRYSAAELKAEIGYSMLCFVSMFALTTDVRRLRLLSGSLALGFAAVVLAATGGYAVQGNWPLAARYGESPPISQYLVIAAPAAAFAAYLWVPRHLRVALALVVAATVLVVVLSGQRATWLGIGLQLAVLVAWAWRTGKLTRPRHWAAALVAALLLAGGTFATVQLRAHHEPYAAMERDLRAHVWSNVIVRIAERPLSGSGFGREILRKVHPDLIPPENSLFWHTHNIVLNYGLSAGVPGMIAIVLLFAAMGLRFWRWSVSGEPLLRAAGLTGALVVAGVFGRNMFNDLFVNDGALVYWAMCGALMGYAQRACGRCTGSGRADRQSPSGRSGG